MLVEKEERHPANGFLIKMETFYRNKALHAEVGRRSLKLDLFVGDALVARMPAEKSPVAEGYSTNLKTLQKGKALQTEAWRRGHKSALFAGNALLTMYGKCG